MLDPAPDSPAEFAQAWHPADLGDIEVLRAHYRTHTFARHAHEAFTIGLIDAGAGAYTSRGITQTVGAGDVFVIHPEEVHDGHAASSFGWTYRVLYVPLACFAQTLTDSPPPATPTFTAAVVTDPALRSLLHHLHARLARPTGQLERATYLTWTLQHLLAVHTIRWPLAPRAGQEPAAVARVRAYIEAHFAENIALSDLAALVHLHPVYLLRTFRATVGLPPHAYLTQIRVRQAKALMRAGVPLAVVAADVGFADQSHLTHHFRRIVGLTPGQYHKFKTF